MWLKASGASTHHVYFGTNREKVAKATPNSIEYRKKIASNGNVFYLELSKISLRAGLTYYWRVDAEIRKKIIYKGDVWSFKTK